MGFKTLIFASATLVIAACGEETQLRGSATPSISGQDILQDPSLQAVFIADQNQELTDHLADQSGSVTVFGLSSDSGTKTEKVETGDSSSKSMNSGKSVAEKSTEKTRTCTADSASNKVTVAIEKSFKGDAVSKKGSKSRSSSESVERIWNHPSADLGCLNKHLDFSAIAGQELGLSNQTTFSKSMSLTSSKANDTRSREGTKKGTRNVEYLSNIGAADAEGMKLVSLKINATSSKSLSTLKDGVSTSVSSSSTTTDLLVDLKRNDGSWSEKLVKSGSISSQVENGAKLNFTFENVLFQKSEIKDSCEPVSGTITGTIEVAGESKAFKVIFSSGDATVTVNEQPSTIDFDFGGCDFGKAL